MLGPLYVVRALLAVIFLLECVPTDGQSTGSILIRPAEPKLNDTVVLTCPQGYTNWTSEFGSLPAGSVVNGNTLTLVEVWYTAAGWYSCENAAQDTLTIDLSLKFLTISPPKARIGETITLTCPQGFNNWTSDHHDWKLPAGSVLNGNTLTLVNVQDEMQGVYTCENDDGYSDSSYLTLSTVHVSPKGPSPNDTVTLTCPGAYSHWSSSHGSLPSGSVKNGGVLTLYNVWKAKGALYTCRDKDGDALSTYIGWPLVGVHVKPEIPNLNDNVTLTCPFGYNNWTYEHGTLPSGSIVNGSVLTLVNMQFGHAGEFNCTSATGHSRSVYIRMICPCCPRNAYWWGCSGLKNLGSIPYFSFSMNSQKSHLQLDLDHSRLGRIPANVFSNISSSLQTLTITRAGLRSLHSESFNNMPVLTKLFLSYNQLGSLPPRVFDGLTSLQILRLDRNLLSTLSDTIFTKLTSLTELHVELNKLTSLPVHGFDSLKSLSNMHVQGNPLSCYGNLCSLPWRSMTVSGVQCTNPTSYNRHLDNVKQKCLASYCHHSAISKSNKKLPFFVAPGSSTSVECLSGYSLNPSNSNHTMTELYCDKNGSFVNASLTCLAITECGKSPCLNGGFCQATVNNYTCTCQAGYSGNRCQIDYNCYHSAISNSNKNSSFFVVPGSSTSVECLSGYSFNPSSFNHTMTELYCDKNGSFVNASLPCLAITECARSPCLNGGFCQATANNYTCTCQAGYTGNQCQIVLNTDQDHQSTSTSSSQIGIISGSVAGLVCLCIIALLLVQRRWSYLSRLNQHWNKKVGSMHMPQLTFKKPRLFSSVPLTCKSGLDSSEGQYENAEEAKGQCDAMAMNVIREKVNTSKGVRQSAGLGSSTLEETQTLMSSDMPEPAYTNSDVSQPRGDAQTKPDSLNSSAHQACLTVVQDADMHTAEGTPGPSASESVYEKLSDQPSQNADVSNPTYSNCDLPESPDTPADTTYSNCDVPQSQDTPTDTTYSNCDVPQSQDTPADTTYSNCDLPKSQDTPVGSDCSKC